MQRRLPPLHTSVPTDASHTAQTSSSTSPFSPQTTHQQQASFGQLQPRARIASQANSQSSSAAGLPTASQGGGASATSGGGPSSRFARASPALSQTASPGSSGPSSGLSRLVLTQIFILLGTINQEKDKVKRDSQAEQIFDMIAQHGQDVYPKTFRRLLQLNSDYVFNNAPQPQGSYEMLSKLVQNVRIDFQEADKVAESIDSTEGEMFKNFDVSQFMEHFGLDCAAKSMLALSLKHASKSDLRTKADAILAHNYSSLIRLIANPTMENGEDLPLDYLYHLIERLISDPPRNWNDSSPTELAYAVQSRFDTLQIDLPQELVRVLQLGSLSDGSNQLVKALKQTGTRATASLDDCKDLLSHIEAREITFTHVANALLYIVLSQEMGQDYDASVFVNAVKDHRIGKRLDWQDVIGSFDRPALSVTKHQFLALYHALLPLAQEYENFDIQLLWGGEWAEHDTQLSFVVAFLSCSPDEIDASTIPRLRKAYELEDFDDATDEVKTYAARAVRHPFVSLDATKFLFNTIFRSQEDYSRANQMGIPTAIINPHTDCFVLAAGSVPRPWELLQVQAFNQLFVPFLRKRVDGADFVFHGLWKRENSVFLAQKLIEAYNAHPADLVHIFDRAHDHGWIDNLTTISNEFGVDLAAYSHSQGALDLEAWLDAQFRELPALFPQGLARMVEQKARLELSLQRQPELKDKLAPSFVVKTMFGFLNFLLPHLSEENQVSLLKLGINAYPRIINYGEGFDELIDANGAKGHQLSPEVDQVINEHFNSLYGGQTKVRDVIESLQGYKQSEDPREQELFACMINGLFDEYNCFAEYPVDALSTTAVLFGGIINFNLLSPIALQVGLAMALEAVQASKSRDEKMYKFGLQAMKQFQSRLSEWPTFCERLLRIDELQGTAIWTIAQEVLQNDRGDMDDLPSSPQALANGNGEEYLEPPQLLFSCIHPDPPAEDENYEPPSEEIQDKVLFVLNNISPGNLSEKFPELKSVLEIKHQQWLAEYIVEERAKLQANFQNLYLGLLELFDNKKLWREIIRETYISVSRLLNHEATMTSAAEKNHLKSLGSWLGSVTLARDLPIKMKNLSFQDLLIEAHATKRLPIAIPFTAKVLLEAAKSEIFQPPNPWCVEILRILLELYHHADLRINLKFEIEALCGALKFDMKKEDPANVIRMHANRTIATEDDFHVAVTDGLEGFGDMTLQMRNRASRGSFSPDSLASGLPDMSSRLIYPPNSNLSFSEEQVNTIYAQAALQAITEIIYPVVERSVTIAAIATTQLITKDFALEADENKLRSAAQTMVKSLSGSLAMVTCREPLRMSMSNHVRNNSRTLQTRDESFPEGVILMFVNDNIDVVCRVIEEAAEKHSAQEIENQIRDAVHIRQMHHANHSEEVFNHPHVSKYAYVIPDPFKPSPTGLRPEQLAIYDNFGATRNLTLTTTQDIRQPLPDVMQDQFSAVVPTATDANAQMRQASVQRSLNSQGIATTSHSQVNGIDNELSLVERIERLYTELFRAALESPEQTIKSLSQRSPVRDFYEELTTLIENSGNQRDNVAMYIGQRLPVTIYSTADTRLEIEVAVQLLNHLCHLSMPAARHILVGLASLGEEQILQAAVTVALVGARMMDLRRVDSIIAKGIRQGKTDAVECLAAFVDELLLSEHPIAIRANFAMSFEVLTQWMHEKHNEAENQQLSVENSGIMNAANALMDKLQIRPSNGDFATLTSNKQDEIGHIFEEWVNLQRPELGDKTVATFIHQIYSRGLLRDAEQVGQCLRSCLEQSIKAYELEENSPYGGSVDQAYTHIDALAGMIIALCLYHGSADTGEVKLDKASFLESMLSIVILFQCDHWKLRGEEANQKIFYRLYSSILSEIYSLSSALIQQDELYLVISKAMLAMQPNYLPGFVFGWFGLVSHRIFIPAMLNMTGASGIERYLQLLHIVFDASTGLMTASSEAAGAEVYARSQEYFRGVLRLMVVLHHDFPDFFAQNYLRLCNRIPLQHVQLKNLVLSAIPSTSPELPNPFGSSLNFEMLAEMHVDPVIQAGCTGILADNGILKLLDSICDSGDPRTTDLTKLCIKVQNSSPASENPNVSAETHRFAVLNSLVLHVCTKALSVNDAFDKSTSHAKLLNHLARALDAEEQHLFINAIVDQLRFPSSHTNWNLSVLLDMFGGDATVLDAQEELMQLITRTLVERLHVHRPHPWGVIVALLELYKNYQFWELPFVKAGPEVEKLFNGLNNHINSGPPRSLG